MRPEILQIAVLIAAGAVIVLVPVLLLWLGQRIRADARESTDRALAALQAEHQHELGLFTQKRHEVYARLYARYRRAADAIAALDRGDVFAMAHLMSRMHGRVALRDANRAFEHAAQFEELNELYLSDSVRDAVEGLRRNVEALSLSVGRETDRGDSTKKQAKRGELESALTSVLQTMRNELGDGRVPPDQPPHALPASEAYRQIRSKS